MKIEDLQVKVARKVTFPIKRADRMEARA